jgi:CxxC motif-containing protein
MTAGNGTGGASPSQRKELVCIACPLGCRMTVTIGSGPEEEATVTGNRCARGEAYGKEEILAPRRIVTAVVPTDSASFPCAPVRTDKPISRGLIRGLLSELYGRQVRLPVKEGQVLVEDFDGARVIFTRTLPPDEIPAVREAGAKPEGQDEVPGLQQAP